jgi:hypothetical protein
MRKNYSPVIASELISNEPNLENGFIDLRFVERVGEKGDR